MPSLDPDLERLIDEEISDLSEQNLLKNILDWQVDKIQQPRYGKLDQMDEYTEEYLNDAEDV
ncbi:hypothetical protein [Halocatena salina]|uniref:Uncharacterized protein n=1 Tax=Halocatena salina TaxID=2934340 RepID=A0A8U0A5F5_9EURY|nr:hypothetical protein [Halocatena salina]UPM43183.1 hypothetical protein MW046_01745 [Halocatena salina]